MIFNKQPKSLTIRIKKKRRPNNRFYYIVLLKPKMHESNYFTDLILIGNHSVKKSFHLFSNIYKNDKQFHLFFGKNKIKTDQAKILFI